MDPIAPRYVPLILPLLVNTRIPALEVHRESQQSVVFVLDDITRDFLLYDSLSPVVFEPVLLYFLLCGVREEKGVCETGNIKVDFEVNDMVVQGPHCTEGWP